MGLAYVNLVLATAIPITWLLTRALHGLRPGWLASVAGRIRWRFLVACVGLSVVALVATVVVSAFVPQQGGTEIGHRAQRLHPHHTRLPARGAVPHAAAGGRGGVRVPRLPPAGVRRPLRQPGGRGGLSALLFALAHGLGQSWPVFVDRLAFGLVAGVLVIVTGGLEAGIAMHVLNNFLAFGLALAFSDMASTLNPTGGVVVEPARHPHPVARLPRPGDLDGPADGALDERPGGRFGGPARSRVMFLLGPDVTRKGRKPVSQWDMV